MPTEEEVRLWKEVHIPEAMGKLREAYRAVYDDPYRASGAGQFKRYLNKFDKMLSAMGDAVDMVLMKRCHDNGVKNHQFDSECRPIHFFHEASHFIMNARYNKTHEEDQKAIPILEKYLVQVHVFLDRGEFDRFSVYSGDCGGNKGWWNYVYDEEDRVYTVADEDLEEYAKAYNIMAKWAADKTARGWVEHGKDRISRMLRNVIKRMEAKRP
jgi:hypothetical protein